MKSFVLNRHGSLVLPANLFAQLDFSVIRSLAQFEAIIKRDMKKQEAFMKKHPDEKPPWAEGDLFSSLFEGPTSYEIGKMRTKGATREVDVYLHHVSEADKVKWTDTVALKKAGGKWVITNILFKGKWAFKSGNSLLNALK